MKKRTLFITIISVVFAGLLITGIITIKNINNKKTTFVAFYDIPKEVSDTIIEILTANSKTNYSFNYKTEKDLLSKKFTKKNQLLFCYNDANTINLKEKAVSIPEYAQSCMPSTYKSSKLYSINNQVKIMPVAVDIFEAAYLETTAKKYEIPIPQDLDEIKNFAHTSKYYYAVPLIITGENDVNINSLFTMFVQDYGGKEAYFEMLDKIKNTTDFSTIYDYKVGGLADNNMTVSDLLDMIKEWQDNNYFAYNWNTMSLDQTNIMIEDNHAALSFMNLSEHRNKPFPNAKYFKMLELPCSVQPVIVGMGFKNSEPVQIAMNRLASSENQELISFKTKLGPSMLQGISTDIQADDARYFAASTETGPVPDLGTAALKTKEQRFLLAQAIRNYFN